MNQFGARGDADVGLVSDEVVGFENPGTHRDHAGAGMLRGLNIVWRIAKKARRRSITEPGADLGHSLAKDVFAHLAPIAETAKLEEVSQPCGLHLLPAHLFEIA